QLGQFVPGHHITANAALHENAVFVIGDPDIIRGMLARHSAGSRNDAGIIYELEVLALECSGRNGDFFLTQIERADFYLRDLRRCSTAMIGGGEVEIEQSFISFLPFEGREDIVVRYDRM